MGNVLQRRVIDDVTKVVGRHDDPRMYGGPDGDPGLTGPGSVSWLVNGDIAAVTLAGTAAITLEILHPSVMAGVQQQSSYRSQPFRRAQTTLGYVLGTTFGNTEAATELIARVRRVHSRVVGTRPDGVAYEALDPELLTWVHTCIPWMIMRAYERYGGSLTAAERDRYLAEQAVIGRMAGTDWVPSSVAELEPYVESMRPRMAVTAQTREFFAFLLDSPFAPKVPVGRGLLQRYLVHAGMSLAPGWARSLTGFDLPGPVRAAVVDPQLRAEARLLRWAFGTPPWVAMASARAGAASSAAVLAAA